MSGLFIYWVYGFYVGLRPHTTPNLFASPKRLDKKAIKGGSLISAALQSASKKQAFCTNRNQSGFPGNFSCLPPSGSPTYFYGNWVGLSHYLHSDISCYRCTRKVTQIFHTGQELIIKLPRLFQPTEAATVRRIRKGETSPLRRPGL